MNNAYAYAKAREIKTLSLSLFLHVGVVLFYFGFLHQKSLEVLPAKTVVMEIATFERPPVDALPVAQPTPPMFKPVQDVAPEPIKPVVKPKPSVKATPKSVVKKEAIAPIKEEVAPAAEQPTPAIKAEPTPVVAPTPTLLAEPYIKTDFEIIRDTVLSRLVYPSIAKRMQWNGVVHVGLEIDTSGFLIQASIHQSSGRDALDKAALEAANTLKNQSLPKPTRNTTVILPIAFKMR